ncbi:MAG: type 1 glutamine amidotransferase [Proteobacteria bacterium]|nr:type 1 glutamine amidotransferase [Pseudomonadota bacterium]MBU1710313.1 type 1 glutamine amidotransferase [Pseudomonadota bacterium]
MELKGKKIIVLVENLYNDREFWYPYYRLKEAGARVTVVGPETGRVYNGAAGIPAVAEQSAGQINPDEYDGLVIPGGYAPDHMRRHPAMVKLVRDMVEKDKLVAAICHAGWMLASAKVLQGRTVTCFFAIKDDVVHAGATFVDEAVVVDGKLVTSRTPDDLPAFLRAIIAVLVA